MALSSIGHVISSGYHDLKSGAATVAHAAGNGVAEVKHEGNNLLHRVEGPGPDQALSPEAKAIVHDDHAKSATQVASPSDRSKIAWDGLKTNMGGTKGLLDSQNGQTATAWTYGQTMVASLDQAKQSGNYQDFDNLVKGLGKYKTASGGYAPDTNGVSGKGQCYYDDNSWIGLAFMQASNQSKNPQQKQTYLKDAEGVLNFVKTGQQPNGGLEWHQGQQPPSYNTCTEGPAAELALRVHMATYKGDDPESDPNFKFAQQIYGNMQGLQIQSGPDKGMYGDHIKAGDPPTQCDKAYSYNQGVAIGASTLFYQATGDPKYLQNANDTADASMQHYSQGDHLWKQPPSFNAIYMRNLMQLNAVDPNPKYGQFLQSYNDRLWNDSLNPESGLFDKPSADPHGHYGGSPGDISTLDQAGLVQLFSLQSMSTKDDSELT